MVQRQGQEEAGSGKDSASTPTKSPHLHRAERLVWPQPRAREWHTLGTQEQCLALAAWHSHFPFLKPKDSHSLRSQGSPSESHPITRVERRQAASFQLCWHNTKHTHTSALHVVEMLQKHIQGFGRATSRAGTSKLHCAWTKDVNGHTDPSPLPEQTAEQDDLRSCINSPHPRNPQSSYEHPKPSRFCNCRHHKTLWDVLMYGCASRAEQWCYIQTTNILESNFTEVLILLSMQLPHLHLQITDRSPWCFLCWGPRDRLMGVKEPNSLCSLVAECTNRSGLIQNST